MTGAGRGLQPCQASAVDRSHSAVCTETEIPKGGIEFSGSAEVQAVGPIRQIHKLEFEKSASNRGRGFPINSDQARANRRFPHRDNFFRWGNFRMWFLGNQRDEKDK
jgi:hypothetical protein